MTFDQSITDRVINRLPVREDEPCGIDCFGDDRDSLNDLAKYYNNAHLSDVNLVLGDQIYASHRLILAKGSEVFDRMLSQRWNGEEKDVSIVEDPSTIRYFPSFLRFLYCNHVVLHHENVLPILILADKYNVASLKRVCVEYAISSVIPHTDLREIFNTWFSYSTKVFHQKLTLACVDVIAPKMHEIISTPEWEKTWESLDRDQLIELLKSNSLSVKNEFSMWEALLRWLSSSNHSERRGPTAAPLLSQLIPMIRFSMLSPQEISIVEDSILAKTHGKILEPLIGKAYKAHAVALTTKARDCTDLSSLLRDYSDLRWDRRFVLKRDQLERGLDHEFKMTTRSPTIPIYSWSWTLRLSTQGSFSSTSPTEDSLRIFLNGESIDHPRHVEFLVSFVDDRKVIKSIVGKNQFTKSRYSCELEMGEKISIRELATSSSKLLNEGELHIQITIRPLNGLEV
ncbi:hypothetical protein PRIPAC_89337 [Pristionchus pacificus]|uniref:BTB And C-terminal Kelch domain containing protein n=1 Tax=Pristionchus pacificus TaxID=54126 RepID=A0A2A6B7M6_PRIPA|nr:hypothetical protein PRIPAC_89337 [Pristionchus pacificus]|eukprot:PDM61876.1 BTB And C-terminal Kelch domain containing protein [Pristionchus pacificus]